MAKAQIEIEETAGTSGESRKDIAWLQALEEKVHAAAGRIRELREENAGLNVWLCGGGKLAGQLLGGDLHRRRPALEREAHARAFAVDERRGGRGAHQRHRVPRHQQLGGEERPVGSAEDQDSRRHDRIGAPKVR